MIEKILSSVSEFITHAYLFTARGFSQIVSTSRGIPFSTSKNSGKILYKGPHQTLLPWICKYNLWAVCVYILKNIWFFILKLLLLFQQLLQPMTGIEGFKCAVKHCGVARYNIILCMIMYFLGSGLIQQFLFPMLLNKRRWVEIECAYRAYIVTNDLLTETIYREVTICPYELPSNKTLRRNVISTVIIVRSIMICLTSAIILL